MSQHKIEIFGIPQSNFARAVNALLLPILAAVRLFPEGARAIDAAPNLARYFILHSSRASFVATDPWQASEKGEAA